MHMRDRWERLEKRIRRLKSRPFNPDGSRLSGGTHVTGGSIDKD